MNVTIIMSLFSWKKLNPLELMLLDKLQQALPAESGEILRRQLQNIDYVNRMAGYREVLCYRKKAQPSHVPAFPAKRAELKFATVYFSNPARGQSWTADFYLVKGYFFSIVFTPTPKPVRNAKEVQIDNLKILADPSKAIPERTAQVKPVSRNSVKLPVWVEQLESELPTSDFFEPLPNDLKEGFLKEITGAPPEDYLSLAETTEGFVIGNMSIFGVSQIYEIVMPDWNYYVVAELHSSGVLAVKANCNEPELYFLDYEGAPPRDMGKSLAEAISLLISEKSKRQIGKA